MKFTSTIVIAALATVGLATPQRGPGGWPGHGGPPSGGPGNGNPGSGNPPSTPDNCLTKDIASKLVDGFGSLLTAYTNETAEVLLSEDFTDTSDSINFLAGIPLGSTTFPTKEAFMVGQGSQPPIGFEVLNIDAVTCDTIAFRWAATIDPTQPPVKGINILNAVKSEDWQISRVFSEFNSGTWSQYVGGVCA